MGGKECMVPITTEIQQCKICGHVSEYKCLFIYIFNLFEREKMTGRD